MVLNFQQITALTEAINQLQETKVSFKLGLILAKNASKLKAETEFYIEREREFANKFLEQDENGNFVQTAENVFKIKEGMEEECREARVALDAFTTDIDLRKIPISLVEDLDILTPKQIEALEPLIDDGTEEA
jgi:hypothetical protein